MLNNSNLYNSEWLALVFKNRNKTYGAYVLRSESASIMMKAFLMVVPVFVLLFVGPLIYGQLKPKPDTEHRVVIQTTEIEPIHEMVKEEIKKEEPKKELPKAEPVVAQAKTVNMSSNIVVKENTDQIPPTTEDLKTAVIASSTQAGTASTENALPVTPTISGGSGSGVGDGVDNEIYTAGGVEKYPEFPGGMEAWAKFIQKNLRYPYAAQETGIQGKVFLSFVVEKDGSITNVAIVKGIGGGCDEEAMRVIKKSPKWQAGVQNKMNVRVRYNMPINYTLSN